ncbi:hypothetical protein Tco_0386978 [Tanacetum coccineum]
MILESVEHGPLIWPIVEENGVIRTKKYAELFAAEKIQADCDMKATNIILQALDFVDYRLLQGFLLPITSSELPLIEETKPLFKMEGFRSKVQEDMGIIIRSPGSWDTILDDGQPRISYSSGIPASQAQTDSPHNAVFPIMRILVIMILSGLVYRPAQADFDQTIVMDFIDIEIL